MSSAESELQKLPYPGQLLGGETSHGPRRGTLIFSAYVGSDPASTVHPQKISGISNTPKKYQEF